ncbi:hypothetical protein IL306_008847, partial [Fusarium sp. DS 682]
MAVTSGPAGTRLASRIPGLKDIAMVSFVHEEAKAPWLTEVFALDIISEFTELKDGEEMPRDELCSVYYQRRLAIMQSSSYSVYNHYYQSQLEKVYKTCGGSGPTELPPPPKIEEP